MKINELNQPDSLSTVQIYDNGGKTNDRYTVYFPSADYHIRMSDFPSTPRGIYNKEGGRPPQDEKLGKQININQMARGAKEKVMQELKGHDRAGFL